MVLLIEANPALLFFVHSTITVLSLPYVFILFVFSSAAMDLFIAGVDA